jgi:hypothetical protein
MSVPRQRAAQSSLRAERNRHRLQRAGQRLELVIAAMRERPADRARRMDARAPTRPRQPSA